MKCKRIIISIIVTFYNEEILLSRCLQSILNQTCKNYELLLINDGSTDGSIEIAKKYQSSFTDIKIITISNSGHAEARNVGLKNANGDYVTFLDADDEFEINMIEEFQKQILFNNSDLIICDFLSVDENKSNELKTNWRSEFSVISRTDELARLFYNVGIPEVVWSKVFKTSIAKQISFSKGLWFDDRPFLIEFILKSESVSFIPQKLIVNYRRKTSITRKPVTVKRVSDVYKLFEVEREVLRRNNQIHNYKMEVYKNSLDCFMDAYLMQIIDKKEVFDLKEVRKSFLYLLSKYKIEVFLDRISFKWKDKLALFLLTLPEFIGWEAMNFVFSILKRKRLSKIRMIKNTN